MPRRGPVAAAAGVRRSPVCHPYADFGNQRSPTGTFAETSHLLIARVTRLNAAAPVSIALTPWPPVTMATQAARSAGGQAQAGGVPGARGAGPAAQQPQSGSAPQARGRGARVGLARGA